MCVSRRLLFQYHTFADLGLDYLTRVLSAAVSDEIARAHSKVARHAVGCSAGRAGSSGSAWGMQVTTWHILRRTPQNSFSSRGVSMLMCTLGKQRLMMIAFDSQSLMLTTLRDAY
jgi:hypothetical protein